MIKPMFKPGDCVIVKHVGDYTFQAEIRGFVKSRERPDHFGGSHYYGIDVQTGHEETIIAVEGIPVISGALFAYESELRFDLLYELARA